MIFARIANQTVLNVEWINHKEQLISMYKMGQSLNERNHHGNENSKQYPSEMFQRRQR